MTFKRFSVLYCNGHLRTAGLEHTSRHGASPLSEEDSEGPSADPEADSSSLTGRRARVTPSLSKATLDSLTSQQFVPEGLSKLSHNA